MSIRVNSGNNEINAMEQYLEQPVFLVTQECDEHYDLWDNASMKYEIRKGKINTSQVSFEVRASCYPIYTNNCGSRDLRPTWDRRS